MSKTKHTPGPWQLKKAITANSNEYTFAIGKAKWGSPNIAIADTQENGCLIAAAPELLEALKHARHRLQKMQSEGYPQDQTLSMVESALAKAEGEENE